MMVHFLFGCLTATLLILSVVTLLPSFGPLNNWVCQLFPHFRLQWMVGLLVGLLTCLVCSYWKRRWILPTWVTMLALVCFAVNMSDLLPYYTTPVSGKEAQQPVLRVFHLNVYAPNRRYDAVAAEIRRVHPDMVDLMEYTETFRHGLESTGVFRDYPYRQVGQSHLGLYSKVPLDNLRVVYTSTQKTENFANVRARFQLDGQSVELLVAHPHWPVMGNLVRQRHQFTKWQQDHTLKGRNVLVVGDFNATPWSQNFKQLLRETGWRDSQVGFGVQPSWPEFISILHLTKPNPLFRLCQIPIDHVLVGGQVQVLNREIGHFVGSDHLPVIVDLQVKQ